MGKGYRVGVVGIGTVGVEMLRVLQQRKFPVSELRVIARSKRQECIDGKIIDVLAASPEVFDGLDLVLFAGTEGDKGASKLYGWEAVRKGAIVIDNGDDFRMDERVPLVIPEINAHALKNHQGFISNPNCSTIIALMALAPLHRVAEIESFIVSTYQSVSGTGRQAIQELENQIRAFVEGREIKREVYSAQIAFNLFPAIGRLKDTLPGYSSEEAKMLFETRKILENNSIKVSATCVRVPTFYGHAESINVRFKRPLSVEEAREILLKAEGVKVVDDYEMGLYPMPLLCAGKDEVLVGRIRKDNTCDNGLVLFVAGDNIRKGAALNAVQIAERLFNIKVGR